MAFGKTPGFNKSAAYQRIQMIAFKGNCINFPGLIKPDLTLPDLVVDVFLDGTRSVYTEYLAFAVDPDMNRLRSTITVIVNQNADFRANRCLLLQQPATFRNKKQ